MTLLIARGTLDDVTEVDVLIRATAEWLIQKGEKLWGPNEMSREELERVARVGELVIGRVSGELATCMYLHNEDRLFWPQCSPGEAFYIHRLAVARKFAGHGYSHAMLEWAANEARTKGRAYLGSTASLARNCWRSIATRDTAHRPRTHPGGRTLRRPPRKADLSKARSATADSVLYFRRP